MWNPVWPGVPADDVPITSVTNGIHTRTWINQDLEALLGDANPADFSRIAALPDAQLWKIRTDARERMITYVPHPRPSAGRDESPCAGDGFWIVCLIRMS